MARPRKRAEENRRRVSISEFKTHCLRLLDEVSRGKELVVTRHGEEIAVVGPIRARTASDYGSLRGLITVRGEIIHSDWSEEFDVTREETP